LGGKVLLQAGTSKIPWKAQKGRVYRTGVSTRNEKTRKDNSIASGISYEKERMTFKSGSRKEKNIELYDVTKQEINSPEGTPEKRGASNRTMEKVIKKASKQQELDCSRTIPNP